MPSTPVRSWSGWRRGSPGPVVGASQSSVEHSLRRVFHFDRVRLGATRERQGCLLLALGVGRNAGRLGARLQRYHLVAVGTAEGDRPGLARLSFQRGGKAAGRGTAGGYHPRGSTRREQQLARD